MAVCWVCEDGLNWCRWYMRRLEERWWRIWFLFFFQAEDGIRDLTVTGVQTCALPICVTLSRISWRVLRFSPTSSGKAAFWNTVMCGQIAYDWNTMPKPRRLGMTKIPFRSEERRVGEESRSRWSPDH